MERVSKTLQFTVVIKSAGPVTSKFQALQKLHLCFGGVTTHRRITQKFMEARFFFGNSVAPNLIKLKSNELRQSQPLIQNDFHTKCSQVDIPVINHWIQESVEMLRRNVAYFRVQKCHNN